MYLFAKAKDLDSQSEYVDDQGRTHVNAADASAAIFEALPPLAAAG